MQSGVDEVLGFIAGKIEPRAPQTVTLRRRPERHRFWQRRLARCEPGAAHGGFNASSDHERQRTFIHNLDQRVLDAKRAQHVAHLLPDDVAVIQFDARAQDHLNSAAGALFEDNVQVGANVVARTSRLAPSRRADSCGYRSQSENTSGAKALSINAAWTLAF